jgi:hypothetical protein
MFSRKSCYFFVRPNPRYLEICVFLGRSLQAPQVRRVVHASRAKLVHIIHITHRDEVEAPITDWLREAYEVSDTLTTAAAKRVVPKQDGSTQANTKLAKRHADSGRRKLRS